MKWTTTNYKGEPVTWYSEDEYLRSISQLEKENTELRKDIKACNTCERSAKIYGNENAELKAENEKLKHSNENLRLALKTYEMPEVVKVLTDYRTGELDKLYKENQYRHEIIVALKEKIDKQVKTSKCAWKHFEGTLCPEGDKYKQCLRKIKEIAKANQFYFGAGTIVSYQTIKQIATNFEKILDLITNVESEV